MEDNTKTPIRLNINGRDYDLQVAPQWTLAHVLREELGLTGTKVACAGGECGACTVIIDGKSKASCLTLAVECQDMRIETIEGLSKDGELHPLQTAWLDEYGSQCGFCSPGMIMGAKALLDKNPAPSKAQIQESLSGNLCICSNYDHIVNAVSRAADIMAAKGGSDE